MNLTYWLSRFAFIPLFSTLFSTLQHSSYTLLQYLCQAYFEQTRVIVTSGKPYIPPFLMGLESYKPIDYSLIKPVGPRALSALVEMALRSEPTRAFSTI
jgi:hypothetical protein